MNATPVKLFDQPRRFNSLTTEQRNGLVLSCERLCISLARKKVGLARGLEVDDLTQEALVSCVEASQQWDPDRGVKFSTYAHRCIARHLNKVVVAQLSRGEVQSEDWDGVAGRDQDDEAGLMIEEFSPQQLAAIERLSPLSQQAVRLVLLDQLGPDQIADQLGLSVKDCKLMLRNAADSLRRDLAFFGRPALFDACGASEHDAA